MEPSPNSAPSILAFLPRYTRVVALMLAMLVAACGGAPVVTGAGGPSGAWSYVYSCEGDVRFSVRMAGDVAYLTLDGLRSELARDPQVTGRYSGDGYALTREDERATLVAPARTLSGCEGEASASVWEDAALRGVTYRALGQEPGWYVEVTPGRSLLFVGDYGEAVVLGGAPTMTIDEARGQTTYSATGPAGPILLSVDRHACIDVMSGEGFPTRAVVTVDGVTHQGCGLSLDP
jgi:putative lipoprotein